MSGDELELDPPLGTWAEEVPPAAHSKAERTAEIDAEVELLKRRAGVYRLVDRRPGRSAGSSTSYRGRGCEVTTRHVDGHTEIWARWPESVSPTGGSS